MQTIVQNHKKVLAPYMIICMVGLCVFMSMVSVRANSYTDTLDVAVKYEPEHFSLLDGREFMSPELLYQNVYLLW